MIENTNIVLLVLVLTGWCTEREARSIKENLVGQKVSKDIGELVIQFNLLREIARKKI